MRYVVTGAAGFIGSHLAEALQAAGHEVLGIDCFTDYYDPALKEENARGLDVRRLDLAEDELDLAGCDGVFHLAGQPGVRSFGDVFPLYLRRNVLATQRVFEAAAAAGVRVVFASSSSVYGDAERYPTPEDDAAAADLAVRDHEARVRAPGARVCAQLRARRGRAALLQRLRAQAAPGHGLPARRRGARRGRRRSTLYGDGGQSRSFTYVGDVVAATSLAMERAGAGAVYNVGGGAGGDDARGDRAARADRRPHARRRRDGPPVPGDQRRTKADTTRIRDELGWEPRTPLEDGLRGAVGVGRW